MRGRTPGFIGAMIASVVLGGTWAMAQTQGVDVRDNSFAPATVTIAEGGTVTWTQSGSNPHTVTAADGSFDSHPACPGECMGQGDSFSHTFNTAGEFDYFCKIHGSAGQGMAGTVVVEAAGEDPEPEEEPEEEPEPTDEPADTGGEADEAPGTTDEPDDDEPADTADTDDADDTDVAAADEQDPADVADDGEQLADTGGSWTLLLVGLGLLLSGVVAVRRGRVEPAG